MKVDSLLSCVTLGYNSWVLYLYFPWTSRWPLENTFFQCVLHPQNKDHDRLLKELALTVTQAQLPTYMKMPLRGRFILAGFYECLGTFCYEKNSHCSTVSVLLHQRESSGLRTRPHHWAHSQKLKVVLFALSLQRERILFTKCSSQCSKLEDFSISTWSLYIKSKRLSNIAVPNGPSGEH